MIAYDPYNDEASHSLDEVLAESDVISLHAAVTEDTVGMIGADQFAKMRDGAVFLNTARAQLHDTDALVAALRSGQGRARPGSTTSSASSCPSTTRSTGWPTSCSRRTSAGPRTTPRHDQARLVADGLEALLSGRAPEHIVNPEVLTREKSSTEPKKQVLAAAKDMLRSGLIEGTAGNISARLPDGNVVITPSSVDYADMTLDDLVLVDLDGDVLRRTRGPRRRRCCTWRVTRASTTSAA